MKDWTNFIADNLKKNAFKIKTAEIDKTASYDLTAYRCLRR